MCAFLTSGGLRFIRYPRISLPPVHTITKLTTFRALALMDNSSFSSSARSTTSGGRGRGLDMKHNHTGWGHGGGGSGMDNIDALRKSFGSLDLVDNTHRSSSSFSSFAHSNTSGGRGSGLDIRDNRGGRRRDGGGSGKDKIDALGRLMTRILRHMASELNLNMRSDGYVKVQDLLKLNMKTLANIPLGSHTIDDIREAVRRDNKQRFSLVEENGQLLIRANQGHTLTTVKTESLLKPILSAEEVSVCVHGTYKKNLDSILEHGLSCMQRLHVHFSCGLPTDGEVISGMRRNINVLIFLDVRKALEEGMKLYISDNKVILTEGFDGTVPVKYFQKIESWPDRQPIPF